MPVHSFSAVLIVCVLSTGAIPAAAGEAPALQELPTHSLRLAARSQEKLSEAIFDLIDDVTVAKVNVGDGRIDLRAGRNVYENHDVASSWTVVDHCKVRLVHPLVPATDFAAAHAGNFYASFHVDGVLGLELTNIRQVRPGLLPGPTIALDDVQAAAAETVEVDEPVRRPTFAGLTKARYSRLWNVLAFPCRAPFRPEWHRRMADGEIMSWNTYGTVELGPSLGWDLDLSGAIDSLTADVSFRTFVHGAWRISVLRENARFARVKVARTRSYGHRFSIGFGTDGYILDAGIVDVRIGNTAFYPFVYSTGRERGNTFEVAFRYDLDDARARTAYAAAVVGRLAASEQLASDAGAPVRRLGDRATRFRTTSESTRTRYAFFYRHGHQTSTTASDIRFSDAAGTTTVFRARTTNRQFWRLLWGDAERIDWDVQIDVDRDRNRRGEADALSLALSVDVDDTETDGVELHHYCVEAENAIGRPGFFPRPPIWTPLPTSAPGPGDEFDRRTRDQGPRRQVLAYGRCSFFWKATFSSDQVQRFLASDPARQWALLEAAFDQPPGTWATPWKRWRFAALSLPAAIANIPGYALNLHIDQGSVLASAERAHRLWRSAQAATDITVRVTLLAELFSDRRHAGTLIRLLRLSLIGEPVDYVVQGTSHAFGTRRAEGTTAARPDPFPEHREQLLAFDRPGARPTDDPESRVLGTTIEPLGACRWRLRFATPSEQPPAAVFVRLIERRPWRVPRTLGEVVLLREVVGLVAGVNQIDFSCGQGGLGVIFAHIASGNQYELQLASTRDGVRWGAVGGVDFGPVSGEAHASPHAHGD